jgi:Rrf2 family transcriptional regulator, iron-sulfur cluster assembly transcription factor
VDLLSKRSILAIAAVVDIALYAGQAPASAKSLAVRHRLPPRHLEVLLQGLVQATILKGVRGPRGGYRLAREGRTITVGEIVRTAFALSAADPNEIGASSQLLKQVIEPRIRKAGDSFLANLDAISVEDLCAVAVATRIVEDDN